MRDALVRCGPGDPGLGATAREILASKLRGEPLPALDAIAEAQRNVGEPHPWARVWAARGRALDSDATSMRLQSWLDARATQAGVRRCGAAAGVAPDGTQALVVVTVDALADLAPLPACARSGQWLSLEARLLAPARSASVVLLGPRGLPRTVPSSLDGSRLRARFAPDGPGELTVQVMADVGSGPRPVLEARVLVDGAPAAQAGRAAPGEDVVAGPSDEERLASMIAAARASEGLAPLARDARLDAVARAHALAMAAEHELAHDAGDGDPFDRLRAAGLDAGEAGENVAHAATVALAHRAIWASPSHRLNLLRRELDRLGLAVVRDSGGVWVVETLAGGISESPGALP